MFCLTIYLEKLLHKCMVNIYNLHIQAITLGLGKASDHMLWFTASTIGRYLVMQHHHFGTRYHKLHKVLVPSLVSIIFGKCNIFVQTQRRHLDCYAESCSALSIYFFVFKSFGQLFSFYLCIPCLADIFFLINTNNF